MKPDDVFAGRNEELLRLLKCERGRNLRRKPWHDDPHVGNSCCRADCECAGNQAGYHKRGKEATPMMVSAHDGCARVSTSRVHADVQLLAVLSDEVSDEVFIPCGLLSGTKGGIDTSTCCQSVTRSQSNARAHTGNDADDDFDGQPAKDERQARSFGASQLGGRNGRACRCCVLGHVSGRCGGGRGVVGRCGGGGRRFVGVRLGLVRLISVTLLLVLAKQRQSIGHVGSHTIDSRPEIAQERVHALQNISVSARVKSEQSACTMCSVR